MNTEKGLLNKHFGAFKERFSLNRFLKIFQYIILFLCITVTCFGAVEDLTTYTEVDTGGNLTATSTKATLNSGTAAVRLSKYIKGQGLNGLKRRYILNLGSEPILETCIFGLSDEGANNNWKEWTTGLVIIVNDNKITLRNIDEGTEDESAALSYSTDYYLDIKRNVNQLRCYIYDDSAFSSLVELIELNDFEPLFSFSDITLISKPANGLAFFPSMDTPVYSDDGSSVASWTEINSGGTYSSVTEDGRSCILVTDATGGDPETIQQTSPGALPNPCFSEFGLKTSGVGNYGSANNIRMQIRDGAYQSMLDIYANSYYGRDGTNFAITHDNGTWYDFRVYHNSTGAYYYRKEDGKQWEYIGTMNVSANANTDIFLYAASNDVAISFWVDYLNVGSGTADPFELYIEDVNNFDMVFSSYSNPGVAYPGDLEEPFTTDLATAGFTTSGTGTVETTGGELHITGDGEAHKAVPNGAVDSESVSQLKKVKITSIGAGDAAHIISIKDGANVFTGLAVERGGFYYWSCQWNTTKYDSNIKLELDTYYTIQLMANAQSGTGNTANLSVIVDGNTAVNTLNGNAYSDFTIDEVQFGAVDETNYTANAEWYGDDLHIMSHQFFYSPGTSAFASNGDMIVGCNLGTLFGGVDAFILFKTTDNGATWTYETIDIGADIGETVTSARFQGTITIGDDIYIVANALYDYDVDLTDEYSTYVYKMSVSGGVLGSPVILEDSGTPIVLRDVYPDAGVMIDPNDATKILVTLRINWLVEATHEIKLASFDTDSSPPAWNGSGSWVSLAVVGDYTYLGNDLKPSEVSLTLNPQDSNKTIFTCRWTNMSGDAYEEFIAYRIATGSVYTSGNWAASVSLRDDWSHYHGAVGNFIAVGDQLLWVSFIRQPSGDRMRDAIYQIDPSDLSELLNGYVFSVGTPGVSPFFDYGCYKRVGNGHALQGPDADKIYWTTMSGTAGVFAFNSGILSNLTVNITGDGGSGQWRRVGTGSWLNEGTEEDITPGTYTVEFNDVSGKITPANQEVILSDGETETITGVYTGGAVILMF